MKFSFSFKVPIRERLKILFKGGLYISVDYRGQHSIAKATLVSIPSKAVTGTVTKEK